MANDTWRTPPEVIAFIERKFGKIKIDLCSSDENKVCEFNIDEECDFLDDAWIAYAPEEFNCVAGDLTWCNPPYSGPLPFVKQCVKWARYGYAVAGILNHDTSTKWFVELEKANALIMPVTGGRISFLNEDGVAIKGNNKPQFMFYLAPFLALSATTEYVPIADIYK
jgi:phage N-6-adenine-methyltransferase